MRTERQKEEHLPLFIWYFEDFPSRKEWFVETSEGGSFRCEQRPISSGWDEQAALCVVSCSEFGRLRAFSQHIKKSNIPTLYVIPEQALDLVLTFLRPFDDVCVQVTTWAATVQQAVLNHRVQRLADSWDEPEEKEVNTRDPLTGLFNRRYFDEQLEAAFEHLPEQGECSLLIADIDHFKMFNDQFGHQVGDALLVELANRIKNLAPEVSLVARVGGEEFAILTRSGRAEATSIATDLREGVEAGAFCAGGEWKEGFFTTISIGIATTGPNCSDRKALLRSADGALYAAKARGRNLVLHSEQLTEEALEKGTRPEVETFENMTRVLTKRVSDVLVQRSRRLFEEIQEQADVDSLTGLFSRRYFDKRLSFEFEHTTGKSDILILALLDLDSFGHVNKRYGWPTGDKVLRDVSKCIQENVRADDWVARYGGEELCIVMKNCPQEQAEKVLERIRQVIENKDFRSTKKEKLAITISIGMTMRDMEDHSPSLMLERVSSCLLQAKKEGKNRVVCFGQSR